MREIRDELIEAQINQVNLKAKIWNNKTRFMDLKKSYA